MALPGEILTCKLDSKITIFDMSMMYDFRVEVEYTFWDDNSYTIHSVKMIVPGYPDSVLPWPFKERLLKDHNFKNLMSGVIRSVRHYPLAGS
ncbi:hypothetical protein EVB81_037 [Rhizobium phage RHph_I46]|uniref:Uncharacterized protein n=1 Tax=Rhizobium phage RHph_I1_9 TaxID=2509729 RepID=A0A7S5UXK8_9CAUD|nr:hypothetical protein PP936_gp036 [Rhizobium phage RHph_I1_9]QIG69606.1 hypothetical protein EVB81_037 [Rhizobium phage RHph_I46]QIG70887.1 hypothetical protein EVB92_037 [Rhizobium phage RHph_I9]QIG73473.1 hypothetical protein EVC04_036 [Rhizobium phage RHph_I1_9]QIG76226.1 hypothetical protein EVC25_037 [Rhizobium phage RHph_I34]